jgi:hypothetical protein
MVTGFCLPGKYKLDGFPDNNSGGFNDSPVDHKFPGNKSSDSQPGEIVAN